MFSLNQYFPIWFFIIIGLFIGIMPMVVSKLIGPTNSSKKKSEPYECGLMPFGDARINFNVAYYLVGIAFIVFDIETVFMLPWAVSMRGLGLIGLISMIVFLSILMLGYFYLIAKKVLRWF